MPTLYPVTTTAKGTCVAIVPSVGLVQVPPPVQVMPMPFPSEGKFAAVLEAVEEVMIENRPVVVAASKIPNNSGGEAATKKGVVSGTILKEVLMTGASEKVYANGQKVVCQMSRTKHEGSNSNAPLGMQVVPSQDKVSAAL
jgi:hypothetical protein